jgi:hypothetical protein
LLNRAHLIVIRGHLNLGRIVTPGFDFAADSSIIKISAYRRAPFSDSLNSTSNASGCPGPTDLRRFDLFFRIRQY